MLAQVLLDPARAFVIHVDVAVEHAAPIRISLSNLFQTDTRKACSGQANAPPALQCINLALSDLCITS